jgi:eukaryotic-like serine/threonine-protein kinase
MSGDTPPPPPETLVGVGPADTIADDSGVPAAPRKRAPSAHGAGTRYKLGDMIGRGGSGEVLTARDEQIGRQVAIKRMRSETPSQDQVTRFLREARIQGRLEHPAVVPVHELYYDGENRPFFVMKQLAGTTLAQVITRLGSREMSSITTFSRQRLLRAFADVCLAIEFAHTRGIVHRDLKPANIVLGDFGEVYVLDWGIARVMPGQRNDNFADVDAFEVEATSPATTMIGALLGTPGYISPEQIGGDPTIDGRTDIYALGCILFELLALQPLHPRDGNELASSLGGVDARPSARAPKLAVPPELDAICVRATELDRSARFPTARELGEAVQSYLDGDRDIALRKMLSRAELDVARARFATADAAVRGDALRAAGRALALDPTAREPAELVARLMLEPPATTPPDVVREIYTEDLIALKASGRFGVIVAFAYLAFFPLLYWIGFHDLWPIATGCAISVFIVMICTFLTPRAPFLSGYLSIGANLAMFGLYSYLVSPVVLGPALAVVLVMLLAQHRIFTRPLWLALLGLGATLAPWMLHPVDTTGRDIVLHTNAGALDPSATELGLLIYGVAVVLLATVLASLQDDERRGGRLALKTQAWQLRQLVGS